MCLVDSGYALVCSHEQKRPKNVVYHTLSIGDDVLNFSIDRGPDTFEDRLDLCEERFDIVDSEGRPYFYRKVVGEIRGCVMEPDFDLTNTRYHYTIHWQFQIPEGDLQRIYPGYYMRKTDSSVLRVV